VVNAVVNVVQGRPLSAPMMPMFEYDRAVLLQLLKNANCAELHERSTDHGGHLGAVLMFRKSAQV
jgi:hypothetical protein